MLSHTRSRGLIQRAAIGFILMLIASCSQADSKEHPPAIRALESLGVSVLSEFDVGGGLRAFAAVANDEPIAVYLTSDDHVIVGTRLDATGNRVDDQKLDELAAKPLGDQVWSKLEKSNWVLDGRKDAPRVIYTFSDANCPYCHRFWEAARPWVDSGKVQLRHVLVGIIKEDSPTKAAAILGASDPSTALLENERKFSQGGITPAKSVPANVRKILEDHQMLMLSLGFGGTPAIVVRNEKGGVRKINGMPQPGTLGDVMGPR
ncbi:thiol:disulfide interchange protein DsbG [Pectobacterium actinidiae]|uniref:thiol:disulfide interchange protein DsbG n=1 Tax=Pectobacterium actinidiae TaxID=1507808 RepID=UPI003801639E